MAVLINSVVGIFSQRTYISNGHNVHFKHLTILYVNYTSIKRKKNGAIMLMLNFRDLTFIIVSPLLDKKFQNNTYKKQCPLL